MPQVLVTRTPHRLRGGEDERTSQKEERRMPLCTGTVLLSGAEKKKNNKKDEKNNVPGSAHCRAICIVNRRTCNEI